MGKLFLNLFLIGISVGLFLVPGYGISAHYDKIKVLNVEISAYQEASNNAQKLANQRTELQTKLNAISPEENTRLMVLLPDGIDSIRFILEIQNIVGKLGLPLKNVKYSANKTAADQQNAQIGAKESLYGTFTFEFTTEATFAQFLVLLDKLEKNLRVIDIQSISFSNNGNIQSVTGVGSPSQTSGEQMTYQIKLNTYWLK
jgi:hypothetical protein